MGVRSTARVRTAGGRRKPRLGDAEARALMRGQSPLGRGGFRTWARIQLAWTMSGGWRAAGGGASGSGKFQSAARGWPRVDAMTLVDRARPLTGCRHAILKSRDARKASDSPIVDSVGGGARTRPVTPAATRAFAESRGRTA